MDFFDRILIQFHVSIYGRISRRYIFRLKKLMAAHRSWSGDIIENK